VIELAVLFKKKMNVIAPDNLDRPPVIGYILHELHHIIDELGYQDVVIDFSQCKKVYPNVAVPLAGIFEFYRTQRNIGLQFTGESDFLKRTYLLNPRIFKPQDNADYAALDTVWKYSNSYDMCRLVSSVIGDLESKIEFESNVLQGLEWCLNEVMDNVLQHSVLGDEKPLGYVMAQGHQGSEHVAICVCDYGQGIHRSLQSLPIPPHNSVDAITKAIGEGVTRDKKIGQGNGLWGLHNILKLNVGQLTITSGEGAWFFDGQTPRTLANLLYLDNDHKGTIVDFQVNVKQKFSIAEALNGYTPVNFRLEARENESGSELVFSLKNEASGTGTRQSGSLLRNRILNTAKDSPLRIVIDFNGVSVIASSFADELIGKLVVELGFVGFTQRIILRNMNEFIAPIVNRSVAQRMSDGF
jgi:anti-anti-sigma regulatory factor